LFRVRATGGLSQSRDQGVGKEIYGVSDGVGDASESESSEDGEKV
jgi:hypothetical protein